MTENTPRWELDMEHQTISCADLEFAGRAGQFDVYWDNADDQSIPWLIVGEAYFQWVPKLSMDSIREFCVRIKGAFGHSTGIAPTPHEWCILYQMQERYTGGIPDDGDGDEDTEPGDLNPEIVEAVNDHIAWHVEYEETHEDAGGNYASLINEGWTESDTENLRRELSRLGIDYSGVDMDELVDALLDELEMKPGHIRDNPASDSHVLLGHSPVQEVRVYLSAEDLENCGAKAVTRQLLKQLNRQCDAYFSVYGFHIRRGDIPAYVSSDAVWNATISTADTKRIIADLRTTTPTT